MTEEGGEAPTGGKPSSDFKIENLQGDVSAFLNKYRRFLECCKTDLSELDQVEELRHVQAQVIAEGFFAAITLIKQVRAPLRQRIASHNQPGEMPDAALDQLTGREELGALADRLDLRVVTVLEEPPDGWEGETGLPDQDLLARHLPDRQRARAQYFVCGPPPMLDAVETSLEALGVPMEHIQVERFDLV